MCWLPWFSLLCSECYLERLQVHTLSHVLTDIELRTPSQSLLVPGQLRGGRERVRGGGEGERGGREGEGERGREREGERESGVEEGGGGGGREEREREERE